MLVLVVAWLARLMQRDEKQEPVFSQRLEPGHSVTVTVLSNR